MWLKGKRKEIDGDTETHSRKRRDSRKKYLGELRGTYKVKREIIG